MVVASRQDILATESHYQFLLSAGIPDVQLGDGRLIVMRIYCCGGSIEEDQAIWVYVPPELTVGAGDIVEVRMGRVPAKTDPGVVNTVVMVRQKADQAPNGPCFWQPDNPSLWMRIVYCDGIEKDGWVERKGLRKMWYKPAADAGAAPSISATPDALDAAAPVAVPAAAPAGTAPALESCLRVSVAAEARAAVRAAAEKTSPPTHVRFEEEQGADLCDRKLDLTFMSEVDRSSQVRNRDGAAVTGLLGMMVGAITPWSCPTTYSLDAALGNHAGENLGSFQASKKVTRVGTMTMCPDAGDPGKEITEQLVTDVLQQVATEGSLPVTKAASETAAEGAAVTTEEATMATAEAATTATAGEATTATAEQADTGTSSTPAEAPRR